MEISDERLQRDLVELTQDFVALLSAKYPRMCDAFEGLSEEHMIELMIELCDVFDLYRDSVHEVARLYGEHRRTTGSLEDRDWPEN